MYYIDMRVKSVHFICAVLRNSIIYLGVEAEESERERESCRHARGIYYPSFFPLNFLLFLFLDVERHRSCSVAPLLEGRDK